MVRFPYLLPNNNSNASCVRTYNTIYAVTFMYLCICLQQCNKSHIFFVSFLMLPWGCSTLRLIFALLLLSYLNLIFYSLSTFQRFGPNMRLLVDSKPFDGRKRVVCAKIAIHTYRHTHPLGCICTQNKWNKMEIYYSLVKMQPLALLAVIGWHLCILLFLFKRFLFICISFLFTIRLITFHQHIFLSFSSSSSFTTHNIN